MHSPAAFPLYTFPKHWHHAEAVGTTSMYGSTPTMPRASLKRRRKPKMIEFFPEPGPGEYSPGDSTLLRSPAYTVRDKLSRELDPPPFPGPGHYDIEDSTIGNWGAGMAAHVPEKPNLFLRERIEVFRRGAAAAPDRRFLHRNRRELLELREQELRGGVKAPSSPGGAAARRGSRSSGRGRPPAVASVESALPEAMYVDT